MKNFMNSPGLGSLIFRLIVGLTMAFAHGLDKIPPPDQLIAGVGGMGFPLPLLFAWSLALSEFLGGICIAVGIFTRYAAFFMGFCMAVAVFVAHGADPFAKKEMALLYLASCVLLFFQGGGKFSVDRLIWGK